ncbi:hypothetical protein BpHYR1_004716 [Brachionus plicatilis]|uniref:Uncharacterized protein n=1 Tax=Brachionus plicatilis TaxID=10195 RepID=A0A3M7S5Y7_BRAPC|nr:hypothetical protein BpHYR1_004716 [Brachionus plicatilis]
MTFLSTTSLQDLNQILFEGKILFLPFFVNCNLAYLGDLFLKIFDFDEKIQNSFTEIAPRF